MNHTPSRTTGLIAKIAGRSLYKWDASLVATHVRHGIKARLFNVPACFLVEVSTACNRRCSYCPQSVAPLKQKVMSDALWNTVIGRLADYDLRCFVIMNIYNELALVPNSDRYVRDIAGINYQPRVLTNGDFPNAIEIWLSAGCKQILVTEHPPFKPGWLEKLGDLANHRYVSIRRIQNPDNRAGWVKQEVYKPITTCNFPESMNIRVDGSVSLCCLDYKQETNYGNVATSSLEEIFKSHSYSKARASVARGISVSRLCDGCFGCEKDAQ